MTTLKSHTVPVQGRNRVFPVYFFSQGKTCFHYRGTLLSLQGPCFHNRDFPGRKKYTEKTLFSLQGMGLQCTQTLSSNLAGMNIPSKGLPSTINFQHRFVLLSYGHKYQTICDMRAVLYLHKVHQDKMVRRFDKKVNFGNGSLLIFGV